MIRAKCPMCGRGISGPSLDDLPHFPFCSERCRLIDLGKWVEGSYAIPGPPAIDEPESGADEEEEG